MDHGGTHGALESGEVKRGLCVAQVRSCSRPPVARCPCTRGDERHPGRSALCSRKALTIAEMSAVQVGEAQESQASLGTERYVG